MKHVFLGRFAPFHEGHRILLYKLINSFGIENCIVMIGSSNILDERTPFTVEEREVLIRKIFPNIKILQIQDVFNNKIWLQNLKNIEKEMKDEFIFYGGSRKDLVVLNKAFKTEVLVDRKTEGKGISGTKIRMSYW